MGFFSSFTGSAQRGDIRRGFRDANATINSAFNQGRVALNRSARSQGRIYGNNLTRDRRDINLAANRANAAIGTAGAGAAGEINSNYGAATAYLTPYIQQGARANDFYGAALGLYEDPAFQGGRNDGDVFSRHFWNNAQSDPSNQDPQSQANIATFIERSRGHQGDPGQGSHATRQQVEDTYFNDPAFKAIEDRNNTLLFNRYNAQGLADSGVSREASDRASLDNYYNYLDRLRTEGGQGLQASEAAANIRQNQGNALAQNAQWTGGQVGNNAQWRGGNLAQNNNAMTALRGGAAQNQGNLLNENAIARGSSLAGNQINQANALASSRGIFGQNLLGLGGALLGGLTPGTSGVSAFGNLFGGGGFR